MKRVAFVLLGLALAHQADGGILFSALRDGTWQIYYQASLTSAPRAVGGGSALDEGAPAASRGGRRVAFEIPGQGIRVCPMAGSGDCVSVSAGGSATRPVWEPRSGELVFVRYVADAGGEDSEILATRDGLTGFGPLVTQTGSQDDPDVSPDGRWLVYSSAQTLALYRAGVVVVRHLWLLDLATGTPRMLVPGAHQDMHPDVSPDGQTIAFASDRSGRFEIWTLGMDGEGLTQITYGDGTKTWPTWSPDGKTLMYSMSYEGRQELWLVGTDGRGARKHEPFGPGTEVPLRDADWN